MARVAPGVIVVDATFLRHLERQSSVERLHAVCRGSHLRIYPSAVNVIEVLKHTSVAVRERLLRAMRNPPSQMDLFQLVYLSLHSRSRVLVTNDKAHQEAAFAILTGAYPNARVMSAERLLAA